MRIAIIIPAFNVAAFLTVAIQSVLDQTHGDWSLIIVDDGSSDATAAVASGFGDARITLIHQNNEGVSAARNRGIRHAQLARHDAFLFLDGDDWLAPSALEVLAGALHDAPGAVAACGRYARMGSDGAMTVSRVPPAGFILPRLLARNLYINGGQILIRRDAIAAAGDFRAELSYGEDWEYWTRIALHGVFAAVASDGPLLFVRERSGSAYFSSATDPAAYRPALDAIYRNPAIAARIGDDRLRGLRRRAEAEVAWSVGRELIRHGRQHDGRVWLARSVRRAPSLARLALLGLSSARIGPFRPYEMAG